MPCMTTSTTCSPYGDGTLYGDGELYCNARLLTGDFIAYAEATPHYLSIRLNYTTIDANGFFIIDTVKPLMKLRERQPNNYEAFYDSSCAQHFSVELNWTSSTADNTQYLQVNTIRPLAKVLTQQPVQ